MSAKSNELIFSTILQAAKDAGIENCALCTPTPMVVAQRANPLNDHSPIIKQYHVPDGVCGFAWVVIKPGTSSFAKWLVKHNEAKKHSYGGVSIWVRGYGQSMERKEAYAIGFANYLRTVGINAYADSHMD